MPLKWVTEWFDEYDCCHVDECDCDKTRRRQFEQDPRIFISSIPDDEMNADDRELFAQTLIDLKKYDVPIVPLVTELTKILRDEDRRTKAKMRQSFHDYWKTYHKIRNSLTNPESAIYPFRRSDRAMEEIQAATAILDDNFDLQKEMLDLVKITHSKRGNFELVYLKMAIWEAFRLMRTTGKFRTDTSIYDYIGTLISSIRGRRYDSKSVQNVVETFKRKNSRLPKTVP